jgi:hypothetical protein
MMEDEGMHMLLLFRQDDWGKVLEHPVLISLSFSPREFLSSTASALPCEGREGAYRVFENSFSRGTPYFLDHETVIRGSM